MTRLTWLLLVFVFTLFCLSLAAAQEGGGDFKKKDKKDKGGQDEDGKMAKLLEKSHKKSESERDKVIKEFSKLMSNDPLTDDFNSWFDRVATSPTEWRRNLIERKQIGEIFDRMAARLQINDDKITRGDFLRYANAFWRADQSPPWKDGKDFDLSKEAEKMFKHLDRDGDGYLSPAEMPAALRADLRRWDKNQDGVIDWEEYRAYFPHRLQQLQRDFQNQLEAPPMIIELQSIDDRPKVMRAGKLPAGLPPWFERVDLDRDGQIALWEWRRAGWDLDEFAKLDLNDDGLLTPEEVLKLLAMTNRDGTRPFAYLMEERGSNLKSSKVSKRSK